MNDKRKFALAMEREYEGHIARITRYIIKGEFNNPSDAVTYRVFLRIYKEALNRYRIQLGKDPL